jgi:type VI secretion system protein ImpH
MDARTSERARALQALLASVEHEPWAHDFFALLRRIDALRPDAPRTGHARRPQQEALRLGQAAELDFAPAALARLDRRSDGVPRLAVRFFGLLGPHGPMPLHFTEYVRDRQHQFGDETLAHFLDVFHHRLLSLFYRAWAQAQPAVHLDRPEDARYGAWLGAAAGVPAAAPAAGSALPAHAVLFHAGHLAGRTRHAEALRKVLMQHFGVPVQVLPHIGHWLAVAAADRSALGFAANRAERSSSPGAALGRNANAGGKVWDRQSSFRLHLTQLTLAQYESFLPGGHAWRALLEWVRLLAGPALRWDLQLQLRDDEKPAPILGGRGRLGVHAWLGRRPASPGPAGATLLRVRPATTSLLRRAGARPGDTRHA